MKGKTSWMRRLLATTFCFLFSSCAGRHKQPLSYPREPREWEMLESQARALEERPDAAEGEPVARNDPPAADATPAQPHIVPELATLPPQLRIHVFAIAQADSMLVIGPPPQSRTLLIDLGEIQGEESQNYRIVGERIQALTGKSHLDYFLASHFHYDHVGGSRNGIAGLLDRMEPHFTIGTFIDVGSTGAEFMAQNRGTFRALEANLTRWKSEDKVQDRVLPKFGSDQIQLGEGVKVEILAWGGKVREGDPGAMAQVQEHVPGRYSGAPASENDLSIALEISFGEFEMFTGGDLTGYSIDDNWYFTPLYTPRKFKNEDGSVHRETYTNVESYLVQSWIDTRRESDVEIYRANHHGSRYSSSPDLLGVLDPEVILYSTGGAYGHPEVPVIRRGAETANQLATSFVARESFSEWIDVGGRRVGEIVIEVLPDGKQYRIAGELRRAFTDADEAVGVDG